MGLHAERLQVALEDALKVIEAQKDLIKRLADDAYEAQLAAQDYKNQAEGLDTHIGSLEREILQLREDVKLWRTKHVGMADAYTTLKRQWDTQRQSVWDSMQQDHNGYVSKGYHREIVQGLMEQLEQANDVDELNERVRKAEEDLQTEQVCMAESRDDYQRQIDFLEQRNTIQAGRLNVIRSAVDGHWDKVPKAEVEPNFF